MQKVKRSNNSREAILDAAHKVAVEKGAAKVSLDSVAKEAGLTKGGVLYNFSGKENLISGMLERLIGTYTPRINEHSTQLAKPANNPTLQSVIRIISELKEVNQNIPLAILAAAAHNPELLKPLREEKQQRYEKICQETLSNNQATEDEATLLWAAAEGLMWLEMLGLLPFSSDKKTRLLEVLETKAQEKL